MVMNASGRTLSFLSTRLLKSSFASSSSSSASVGEIGVQDFLKAVGNGVESHADKVSQAIDSVSTLLQTRSGKLKGLGVPCKQRKMILRYTEKYRQGVWRPKVSTKKKE